jgi:hypothetical protein
MKKIDKTLTDPSDLDAVIPQPEDVDAIPSTESQLAQAQRLRAIAAQFDMEGLMTDFPTATELQQFVYDQTGTVLNLKGRANRIKYQVALDTLNGIAPSEEFTGSENPYLDRTELVPEEPLRVLPPRDAAIDAAGPEVTRFTTNQFPHPDPDWRAQDMKCQVTFRKYANNMITYEILGPISRRAIGTKLNKYGREVPEKIIWIDARTGEQIIREASGQLTPLGTRLKGFMTRMRVNRTNQWDLWIDRDFILAGDMVSDNPWAVN